MNLLVRSLSGQSSGSGSASPTSPPTSRCRSTTHQSKSHHAPRHHVPTGPAHHPSTSYHVTQSPHMLFSLESDPLATTSAGTFGWSGGASSSGFVRKKYEYEHPTGAGESGSNFDYYEYFRNYGRLGAYHNQPSASHQLTSSSLGASSPMMDEWNLVGPDAATRSGPRLGGTTRFSSAGYHEEDPEVHNGFKRFWRRSGPPSVTTSPIHLRPSPPPLPPQLSSSSSAHPHHHSLHPSVSHPLDAHRSLDHFNQSAQVSSPIFGRKSQVKRMSQPDTSTALAMSRSFLHHHQPPHPADLHSHLPYDPSAGHPVYGRSEHHPYYPEAPLSHLRLPTGGDKGGDPWDPYRISFIETNVYTPQDVPSSASSPDHQLSFFPHFSDPLPHARFHKHLHGEWVGETVNQLRKLFKPPATQILVNVEKQSKYPFIIFGPLGSDFDPRGLMPTASTNVLSPELRINDGIYEICGSVTRPSPGPYGESSSLDVDPDGRLIQSSTHQSHVAGEVIPADHHTYYDPTATPLGYVVSAFQTFPGEDSERLEENWIVWTGARILYKYLPVNVGLRRIVFYKRHDLHLLKSKRSTAPGLHHSSSMDGPFELSSSAGGTSSEGAPLISYVLLCECLTLTESILTSACAVIDQLRARCCGYSALYINSSLNFPNDDHNHQRDS